MITSRRLEGAQHSGSVAHFAQILSTGAAAPRAGSDRVRAAMAERVSGARTLVRTAVTCVALDCGAL